ncbi:cuticle protein 7-like [Cherax quadricarinatus]
MASKVIVMIALVAAASAELLPRYQPSVPSYGPLGPYNHPRPSYHSSEPTINPEYNFSYGVKDDYSGSNFGHEETRNGYDTQGSYYVHLPDGRLQRVSYTVSGDSGFVAQVEYVGEAQYPAHQPSYQHAPSYRPTPTYQPTPVYG